MAERRPDLEALPYKNPKNIAKILFPFFNVAGKQGTLYYDDIIDDVDAQTDRTPGSAPTATLISSANVAYDLTTDEKICRKQIAESEIALRGGLDKAQIKMSRKGKRSVGKAIELLAIAGTFGDIDNITDADIGASFLQALDVAKEAVEDYADGQIALFGSQRVINRLKRYDEIKDRMKTTGVLLGDVRDVRSISNEQLAAAIDVDIVLGGPSLEWLGDASVYDGYLGVMVLPRAEMDPDEEVQAGRNIHYPVGSDGSEFKVETYYSDDLKSEVLDTTSWVELHVMNKECIYILRGIDENNAITTTTPGA